jgi:uncharacterized protein
MTKVHSPPRQPSEDAAVAPLLSHDISAHRSRFGTDPGPLPPGLLAAARAEAAAIATVRGVQGVVIATADGVDIASSVRGGSDAGRLAALTSSIAAVAAFVSAEAGHGRSTGITMVGDGGFAVVHAIQAAGLGLVLNVLGNGDAVLDQVKERATEAVRRLAR